MKNILVTTGHTLRYEDFVKAENCALFDSSGKRYLDLESGVWCTSVGHCHPRVNRVIAEQSAKMVHSGYCYLNPLIDVAAGKLLRITGIGTGKCVFFCSGSEAVEFSVKMVKSFSDKPYFLTMKNCFLSSYGLSGERSADQWVHFDYQTAASVDEIDFGKICAFVFEPGSSQGLVHFPPDELILKIAGKVRENGGIVIANEVTTGMGRTGEWFGYNHYGFIPDIVAIGKGLGGGYPVSCAVISDAILEKLDLEHFHYGQSHQNDPLGAAVANEVIDIIENENLLAKGRTIGEKIRGRLEEIKNRYGIIKEVRGRGLMIAVEFEYNGGCSYAERVNEELLKRNIILVKRPGFEVFRIDPALTIGESDVEYFLESFEEIVSALK